MVAAKEARSKIRATKEELRQPADIVAGKPFLLRTKFGDPKYAPLDRLWSSADAYVDLAASAADVAEYFKDQKRSRSGEAVLVTVSRSSPSVAAE